MNYLSVTVSAPAEEEEYITYIMFEAGAAGVAVDDPAVIKAHLLSGDWDASVFDGRQIKTGRITVSCTLPADEEGRAAAETIRRAAEELPDTRCRIEELPDEDWQAKWKEGFVSRPVGERFWLVPVWEKDLPVPAGRLPVIVEPGMAFGTGDHATTAMALDMLGKYARPQDSLVDLGCGSGILAIAGKKLGCGEALAVDVDPVCGEAVARHLALNGLPPQAVAYRTGDILSEGPLREEIFGRRHDLVLANINAAIVKKLIPAAAELLTEKGFFICSGIVEMYGRDIEQTFARAPLEIVEKRLEQGWYAYTAVRE